jgi:UPF0271 protein
MDQSIMKLNCDMGESFGHWKMGMDAEIMPYVDMANIACGFHASDPLTMSKTVALAKAHNVTVGAHPAYPDLLGFGRREMKLSAAEITNMVLYQVGALEAICHRQDMQLAYVKPHGALYNSMMKDDVIFSAILDAMSSLSVKIPLMVLASNKVEQMSQQADKYGVSLLFEAFCDRAYSDAGSLVPRSQEGSVLVGDTAIEKRIRELITDRQITTISGKKLSINADAICVHGDHIDALESVKKVRTFIESL